MWCVVVHLLLAIFPISEKLGILKSVSYSVCDIMSTRHWYLPASKSAHQRSLNPPPLPPNPQRPHLSPRILNQRLTDLAIGITSYSNITYWVGRGGEDCGFQAQEKAAARMLKELVQYMSTPSLWIPIQPVIRRIIVVQNLASISQIMGGKLRYLQI